jgi:hypothetical protein
VPVVHVADVAGGYKIPNWAAARRQCASQGMRLATHAQLTEAWKQGLDICVCGWLADGSVGYPIVRPRSGCGSSPAGIRTCSRTPRGIGYDAYCTMSKSMFQFHSPKILAYLSSSWHALALAIS